MPPAGGWPEIGSVLSQLKGYAQPSIPPYVDLSAKMKHRPYNFGRNSFLGVPHTPFTPAGEIRSDMVLEGITLDRLQGRRALLGSFDNFRRDVDASGTMEGLDAFQEQAFGVLTSSRMLEALDLDKEDPRVGESYGKGDPRNQSDAAAPYDRAVSDGEAIGGGGRKVCNGQLWDVGLAY